MERWLFLGRQLVDGYLRDLENRLFLLHRDKWFEELLDDVFHLRLFLLLLGFLRFWCGFYLADGWHSLLILLNDDLVDLIIDEDRVLRLVQLCKFRLRHVGLSIDDHKLWIFLALQHLTDHGELIDDLRLLATLLLFLWFLDFLLAEDWKVEIILSRLELIENAIFSEVLDTGLVP